MTAILYSFRRCPYAIRARMALGYANIEIELREVKLSAKPDALLALSGKATVPVLELENGRVIDESLDIMYWALDQSDPDNWLQPDRQAECSQLISYNDTIFKTWLDRYKYADRYLEQPAVHYRQQAEIFLARLEVHLCQNPYLISQQLSLADIAVFPFIRQFAFVDKAWFEQTPYTHLQIWLENLLVEPLFIKIMQKRPFWVEKISAQ